MKRALLFLLLLGTAYAQEVGTTLPNGPITSNGTTTTIGGNTSQPTTFNGLVTVNGGITAAALAAPGSPTAVQLAATGGFLLHNQAYFYKITATNSTGETLPSSEATFTTAASPVPDTYSATVTWAAVSGATGYKVYRSTTTNTELLLATISGGATTSYTDNTNTTPSGALPASNTTSQLVLPLGTGALPSIGFAGATTLGIFANSTTQLGITTGGVSKYLIDGTRIFVKAGQEVSWDNADSFGTDNVSISRQASGILQVGTGGANASGTLAATNITTTGTITGANTQLLTADSTGITATTPGTIIFTMGTMKASTNYAFHCAGTYSQATAAAANGVSVQGATNAPTRIDAWYNVFTSNAGAQAEGNVINLTSTTQTALSGTFTPSATATVFNWMLDGVVQNGATATTLKIGFFTGNASDALTIKAGSYCSLNP